MWVFFVVCALAAQEQGEPAEKTVEVNSNCARIAHNHYNYTYRPNQCKTFLETFANSANCVRLHFVGSGWDFALNVPIVLP